MQENKNQPIYLLIGAILVLILTLVAVYFFKIRKSNESDRQKTELENVQNSSGSSNKDSEVNNDSSEEEPLTEEKKLDEAPNEDLRQKTIEYLVKNLDQLIFPPKDDKWDISSASISFIGNSYVYVEVFPLEAEIGGMKVLYKIETDQGGTVKVVETAKYKEGEEDWMLVSGEDKFFDYYYDEYGYDDEENKWFKIEYMAETELPEEEETELSAEELKALEEEEAVLSEDPEAEGENLSDQAEKTIVP